MKDILDKILVREVIGPIIILLVSIILYKILKSIIKKAFKKSKSKNKKQETVISIIKNILKYFILIIDILMILDIYHIDTKSILASLGIIGIVAGLAIQDLLKDLISGLSIVFENQFYVGDTIEINGFRGEVIHLGLKTTKLKSYTGEIKIIANRNITEVTNYSLSNSLAIVDFQVPYEVDNEKVEKIIRNKCEELTNKLPNLKGEVKLLGVNKLDSSGVEYRVTVETLSMKHFETQREIMKQIKVELEKHGISIPYNQVVVHNG